MSVVDDSKVVVLTGCASGIGRQLATDLYDRGHRVVATDVNFDALREWAPTRWTDKERIELQHLDVREAEAWERVLDRTRERFGRIDVLCNVAGMLVARWAHEMTLAEVGLTIDVNVKGVIFGSNAAARRMIEQGSGHIVNIASVAGIVAVPGLAVYSASKHAVRAFTLSISQELKRHGVYVTVVCPGPVATPMLDIQLPREEAAMTFSAGRVLTPEQVSKAVIEKAIRLRPLELVIPVPGSGQGQLVRLLGAFPELSTWLAPMLRRRGKRAQERMREQLSEPESAPARKSEAVGDRHASE